jgi:hypothetical protein
MAAYGMQLGGYDMPFVMANGGLPRAQGGAETIGGRTAIKTDVLSGKGTPATTEQHGYEGETITTKGQERKAASKAVSGSGSGTFNRGAWEEAICEMVRKGATYEQLTDPDEAYRVTGSRKTHMAPGPKSRAIFDSCNVDQSVFEDKIEDYYIVPETGQQEEVCFCKDREGNKIPGTEMTPAQIEADGKIEGYTADQGCVSEFTNAYCQEEVTEVKRQEAMQEREDVSLPTIPISSMRLGVADPEKATLAPLMAGERNYLDYRTAAQNLQSASDIQKQGIMNAAGLTFGQKLAAMAKVDAEIAPRIASTVTDVYNKNVATANELAKTEEARDAQYNLARANIDQQYNRDLQTAENQRTLNVNANRQRYDAYRQDIARQNFMANVIGTENFDALGNLKKSRDLVPFSSLAECLANNPGKQAECFAAFGQNQQNTNQQNTTPDQQDQVARFGGKLLPYVYGNSVYPF